MNFNTGVRVLHTSTGVVGNVLGCTDETVTVRPQDGSADFCCPKSECQTLKGRPRKMATA